jgi:hypothetical protein
MLDYHVWALGSIPSTGKKKKKEEEEEENFP